MKSIPDLNILITTDTPKTPSSAETSPFFSIMFFRFATPCRLIEGCSHFDTEDGAATLLRISVKYIQGYKTSQPRRPQGNFHVEILNVENRFCMHDILALPPTKMDPLDEKSTYFFLTHTQQNLRLHKTKYLVQTENRGYLKSVVEVGSL